ncbi:MAG TPA: hypothetical protein VFG47_19315 [Geminicoccaceae bacterium]|nr:hypothetical protein [Geminicoccaceae bacterium]
MHPDSRFDRTAAPRTTAERLLDQFTAYLRGRTADHWLMFLAGLILGVVLG